MYLKYNTFYLSLASFFFTPEYKYFENINAFFSFLNVRQFLSLHEKKCPVPTRYLQHLYPPGSLLCDNLKCSGQIFIEGLSEVQNQHANYVFTVTDWTRSDVFKVTFISSCSSFEAYKHHFVSLINSLEPQGQIKCLYLTHTFEP